MADKHTVTIALSEYRRLLRRESRLDALEAGGVDNWEGYSDALGYDEEDEEED